MIQPSNRKLQHSTINWSWTLLRLPERVFLLSKSTLYTLQGGSKDEHLKIISICCRIGRIGHTDSYIKGKKEFIQVEIT